MSVRGSPFLLVDTAAFASLELSRSIISEANCPRKLSHVSDVFFLLRVSQTRRLFIIIPNTRPHLRHLFPRMYSLHQRAALISNSPTPKWPAKKEVATQGSVPALPACPSRARGTGPFKRTHCPLEAVLISLARAERAEISR